MDVQTKNKLDDISLIKGKIKKEIFYRLNNIKAVNLNLLKYKLFEKNDKIEDYAFIRDDNYYVMPHIIGINFWLIVYKEFIVGFNKRQTKQFYGDNVIDDIELYLFGENNNYKNIFTDITIFDGKFYIDNNNLIYGISDVIVLNGKSMLNLDIQEKLPKIVETLNYLNNIVTTSITIKLSSIFKLKDLPNLIYVKIKNSNLKINGLIFIPPKTNKTYIYINDQEFNILKKNNEIEYIDSFSESLKTPSIPIHMMVKEQCDDEIIKKLVYKKTEITDVFELYNFNENYDKDDTIYENIVPENRLGIAHIPDIKTSHYCKECSNKSAYFVLKSIFNKKFNKWMPLLDSIN